MSEKMKISVIAMALALTSPGALMLAGPASAASTLDQSQTSATSVYDGTLGQSFTAGLTGLLTDFTVINTSSLYAGYDNEAMLVQLYSGSDVTTTDLLATADITPTVSGVDDNFYLSTLGIDVTVGQQYTFVFSATTGDGHVAVGGYNSTNPYAGGEFFSGSTPQPTSDLAFQTYVNPAVVSAAPEPSTWALMIAGIGAIGLAFRQAKRKIGFTGALAT